uniref:Secreted protein n=1 Tax=Ascaris lumbricoides TaxID=6252 RepID=A0A0M3HTF5_ASCLU
MHSYIISSYFFRFHPRKTSDLVELHCRILSQLASFVNTYGEFSKYFPLLYSIALFQSSTEYEEAITSCCIREHNATCFQQGDAVGHWPVNKHSGCVTRESGVSPLGGAFCPRQLDAYVLYRFLSLISPLRVSAAQVRRYTYMNNSGERLKPYARKWFLKAVYVISEGFHPLHSAVSGY